MLTIVLGMGCNTDSTDSTDSTSQVYVWFIRDFNKERFDKCLEAWTEQGILDYSFDVFGHEFEPNTPVGEALTFPRISNIPSDAKFDAHVTVAGGCIVSIENIEQGEIILLGFEGLPFWGGPFSLPGEELGDYTWGAIPDIFDRVLSMSMEDASSPYAYDWYFNSSLNGTYPSHLTLHIRIFTHDPAYYPKDSKDVILLYEVELRIGNFQVTENAPL
jgi:hypothetical protein